MMQINHSRRLKLTLGSVAMTWLFAGTLHAQDSAPRLLLAPHCILPVTSQCPLYNVADPEHLQTPVLRAGDILDIDVALVGDDLSAVSTVRSWLSYDPAVLEARSVELLPPLSQPIPGEQAIDSQRGIIKIGGGTTGLTGPDQRIARVTFRVISTAAQTTISFREMTPDGIGETAVLDNNDPASQLLDGQPSSLIVQVSTQPQETLPPVSGTGGTDQNSALPESKSAFGLLQVQNLTVTSRDRSIFLGWMQLPSSELAGYNVYYGTVSGRYIQRRSLPADSTSLVIRDLEPGTQYFVAIRGFNNANLETTFSHEVSVIVGRPETSTAPLSQQQTELPPDGNPFEEYDITEVPGETGIGTNILFLILASAVIGTGFAWRRQVMQISSTQHD